MSNIPSGAVAYRLAFEVSPVILTGGIADLMGGMLPLISITEGLNFLTGLLSGGEVSLDNFFARFKPVAGSSLINNSLGTYPFANQQVAANAIISEPRNVSLAMLCPVREAYGYFTKLAIMSALVSALEQHNQAGGTYTISTPSYLYTDCIMTSMKDVTSGESKQVQMAYQMDFVQPLLTEASAQQAQNSLMSKISSGTAINGTPSWSGLASAISNPSSLIGTSIIPAVTSSLGSNAATPGVAF